MSAGEIVKVQKPLFSTDPGQPAMIYAEHRQRLGYIAMRNLPDHIRRALKARPKVYAQAVWNGKGWDLGLIVGDRPW